MKNCISLFLNHQITDSLTLDLKGVIGDKHYNKDLERSILITSIKSYKMAKEADIALEYGDLGENILVNFDPYHLLEGTKLRCGTAVIEISKKSTLCKSLTKIDNRLPKLLRDNRGIYAKVFSKGIIKKGDTITII